MIYHYLLGGELPTNRKWVTTLVINLISGGNVHLYLGWTNPLTKWDEPPSTYYNADQNYGKRWLATKGELEFVRRRTLTQTPDGTIPIKWRTAENRLHQKNRWIIIFYFCPSNYIKLIITWANAQFLTDISMWLLVMIFHTPNCSLPLTKFIIWSRWKDGIVGCSHFVYQRQLSPLNPINICYLLNR